jgi:hypothetical protein
MTAICETCRPQGLWGKQTCFWSPPLPPPLHRRDVNLEPATENS